MSRLEGSLFQRADLSLRRPGQEDDQPDSTKETPARQDDVQNLRQLGVGIGSFVAGAAAAGAVVATGGAALPGGRRGGGGGGRDGGGRRGGRASRPPRMPQDEKHRAAERAAWC